MIKTLDINIDRSERSIVRVLGIIERRGYEVLSINCPTVGSGHQTLTVGIRSRYEGRAIVTLSHQIEKLQNVYSVSSHHPAQKVTRVMANDKSANIMQAQPMPAQQM